MRRIAPACLALVLLSSACNVRLPFELAQQSTPQGSSQSLVVFAAASLSEAFGEIEPSFEAAHPGVHITFNFGGSQALRTQIEQGAPADVMASASPSEIDTLVAEGFIEQAAPKELLTNKLVVILPAANPAHVQQLQDLARPGLKLVLAAADVPVGKYARQALAEMDSVFGAGFEARVLANVVSNEDNVKQAVAKVQLGEADAAIVYTSDAVAAPDLKQIEIPANLNVIARYEIAPLAASRNLTLASEFVQYVLSPAGQKVLVKWGFTPHP